MIDYLFKGLSPFIEGASMCGAGGGGYMYGILKPGVALGDVQNWINSDFGGTEVRVHTCEIAET
jgi:hypothetical protein